MNGKYVRFLRFLILFVTLTLLIVPLLAVGASTGQPAPARQVAPSMSAESLAAIAGVVLSLLFSYVPRLSDWFATLNATYKRLAMAGLLLIVALVVFGLSCAGLGGDIGMSVTCDKQGATGLVMAFIAALVANQATYQITPKKA